MDVVSLAGPTVRPGAEPRRAFRRCACTLLLLGLSAFPWGRVAAQAPATPVLSGTAFVGDTTMQSATVVLHHLREGAQGELDSLDLATDGRFTFPLPNVPDPARSDVFFASIRHHGVLYFGPAITTPAQLDSVYEIHAYDTIVAPVEGFPVALQSRSVFFEPDSSGWRVTDLFQLRNDRVRTIVARDGGRVWGHPLPAEAREVVAGEGEIATDAATYEDGDLVVRAALPPGERLFVVRYQVDSPLLTIPTSGPTEALDLLVREPAPPLEVEGLQPVDRIELEAGSTYLRFAGTDVSAPVRIVEGVEPLRPNVEWAAVILALLLTIAAVFVLRPSGPRPATPDVPLDRGALLVEVARLDERFAGEAASGPARVEYERRRAELIRKIRSVD